MDGKRNRIGTRTRSSVLPTMPNAADMMVSDSLGVAQDGEDGIVLEDGRRMSITPCQADGEK